MSQTDDTLQDALYELAVEEDFPSAEAIEAVIQRWPEHAAALMEATPELAYEVLRTSVGVPNPPTGVEKALARFRAGLTEIHEKEAPQEPGPAERVRAAG